MEDKLRGMSKQGILRYMQEEHDVKLSSSKSKQALIRESIEILTAEEIEEPAIEEPVEKLVEEELVVVEEESEPEPEPEVESFKPKWSPSYRRGMDRYYPITKETWMLWIQGRRDTYDLQTIEHWVRVKGSLMVHVKEDDRYVVLK